VAEWVRDESAGNTSWITFEEGEAAFWAPVLESLRKRGLGVPTTWVATTGGGLGSRRLTALAGLVVDATDRLTVVIDGYELASLELAREVDYLLRHSMGRLCFVFVGRVDPILPLYRYRLNDSLLEIRASDLAFSDEEAVHLMRSAGVELADEAVHQLNHRVSGWVVGLRFAAQALEGMNDPEDYLATVLEQTANINEYLVGEVLNAQTPDVRRLLLDTSVTDAFCLELVELLGGVTGVRTLEDLVARGAFVEPVPGLAGWFRYYPFFRRFLRAELAYESPDRMEELRRTASRWLRSQGQHVQSLAQLATIGAWEEMAAQIVDEGLVPQLLLEEQGGALTSLALRLPSDVALPSACVVRAVVAHREGGGGDHRCRRELAAARRAGRDRPLDRPLAVSIAAVDALRACLSGESGAAAGPVEEAERLLGETPASPPGPGGSGLAAVVAFSRGVADLRGGHLADAGSAFARAGSHGAVGVATAFRADCLGYLALTDAMRGELSRASRRAEESFAVAAQAGLGPLDVSPSAHVAMAWVGVERYDTDLAREHVALAGASQMLPAHPTCNSLLEAATAAVEQADGHLPAAADRLAAAADAATSTDPRIADLLRVEAARLTVRTGDPEEALRVLASVQDPELPDVVVTTVAAHAEQGGSGAVEGLQEAVDQGEPSLSTQVRALLAEAAQTSHERSPAQAGPALSRALRLATKEGMSRPFREAGPSARRVMAAHPRMLQEHRWLYPVGAQSGPSSRWADLHRGLPIVVEPLTAKELEVLGHVAELLTTDEIAQKMFVSVNTIRTHIRNILRKLGVNRRNAAIRRARELGILEDRAPFIRHG